MQPNSNSQQVIVSFILGILRLYNNATSDKIKLELAVALINALPMLSDSNTLNKVVDYLISFYNTAPNAEILEHLSMAFANMPNCLDEEVANHLIYNLLEFYTNAKQDEVKKHLSAAIGNLIINCSEEYIHSVMLKILSIYDEDKDASNEARLGLARAMANSTLIFSNPQEFNQKTNLNGAANQEHSSKIDKNFGINLNYTSSQEYSPKTDKSSAIFLLKKYDDIIKQYPREFLKIELKYTPELKMWESKFFGLPYLLSKDDYPKNSKGQYLYLLAQINFEEMPKMDPFPEKGLLQFWIADDYLCGSDINSDYTKQDSFRVIYYPEIQKTGLVEDFNFLPAPSDNFPSHTKYDVNYHDFQGYALEFQRKEEPLSVSDYKFEELLKRVSPEDLDDFEYAYEEAEDISGFYDHKIGGYANYFAQGDVRSDNEKYADKEYQLLQIQTDWYDAPDRPYRIEWKGQGVAHFFISKKDLKEKNFTNVLYYCDWT